MRKGRCAVVLFVFSVGLMSFLRPIQGIGQNNLVVNKQVATVSSDGISTDQQYFAMYMDQAHDFHLSGQFEAGIPLLKKALKLAVRSGDMASVSRVYNNLGMAYFHSGYPHQAFANLSLALKLRVHAQNKGGMANTMNNLGLVYRYEGDFSKSCYYFTESLRLKSKLGRNRELSSSLNNIGTLYHHMAEYDKAILFYQAAVRAEEAIGREEKFPGFWLNIGLAHKEKRQSATAMRYYQQALEWATEKEMNAEKAKAYRLMGSVYYSDSAYVKAIGYYEQALAIYQKTNNRRGQTAILQNLGESNLKLEHFDRAEKQLIKGYNMALAAEDALGKIRAEKALELLFAQTGEKEKEAYYAQLAAQTENEIDNAENREKLAALNQQFETHVQKEKLNALQRNEKIKSLQLARQNMLIFALGWGMVSVSVIVLLIYRQRKKERLSFARIKAQRELIHQKESEKLQLQIELQRRKLASSALNLNEKNRIIQQTIHDLTANRVNFKKPNLEKVDQVIRTLKVNSSTTHWEEFEKHFAEVHPDFYRRLSDRFPDLTPNERKLCAFLRLNLSTKEISAITLQSPHSINVARTRLRKKLGLVNTGMDIIGFLADI